jgi:hypothetical protein
VTDGERDFETRNYLGKSHWITISQPVVDVDDDTVIDLTAQVWQDSGYAMVWVEFYFLRYIPHNPLYRGAMIHKQGRWVDRFALTKVHSRLLGPGPNLSADITKRMDAARKEAASRLIWLEAIDVRTIDQR